MDDLSLNALGILSGTDKSQLGVDYLRHYDQSLAHFRILPFNLVEIGVADGASARMWARYFPNAMIIGVDIQERCRAFEQERIKIEIGSQSDGAFVDSLMAKYPPTIMIDDGSHVASDIIFTFERAFPAVLPGGCYIIEDLMFHGGPNAARNRGTASIGGQDYVLIFAKQLLDGQTHPSNETHAGHLLSNSIDRIEIIGRAALFWKKRIDPRGIDYEWLELLTRRSGTAKNWAHLAGYTLRTNGPLLMAERAAREAVAVDAQNWSYQYTLSEVLERAGDLGQALACMEQAARLAHEPWRDTVMARLARIKEKLG